MNILHFSQILGNSEVLQLLHKAAATDRLPHALIFSGPEGVGKKTAALSLTALLFCTDKNGLDFCERCRNCRLLDVGNHPDLHWIKLLEDRKEIGIDSIRELINSISKKPFIAPVKSVIIDEAELMTDEASNALLKVLEEPPGKAYFFLITSRNESLLPTIRSRTQLFRFSSVPTAELEKYLKNKLGFADEEAVLAAGLSQGSVGYAVEWSASINTELQSVFDCLKRMLTDNDHSAALELSAILSSDRKKFDSTIAYCYSVFRDLLSIKYQGAGGQLLNRHQQQALIKMAERLKTTEVLKLIDYFNIWTAVNRKNLNLKLNADDFIIKVQALRKKELYE